MREPGQAVGSAAVGRADAAPAEAGQQPVAGAVRRAAAEQAAAVGLAERHAVSVAGRAAVGAEGVAAHAARAEGVARVSVAHAAAAGRRAAIRTSEVECYSRAAADDAAESGSAEHIGDSRCRGRCGDSCLAGPGDGHSVAVGCTMMC